MFSDIKNSDVSQQAGSLVSSSRVFLQECQLHG